MPLSTPEAQREYQRVWASRRRQKYIQMYGGCCVKCGSKEKLEFDHIDPSLKKDHKVYSWKESRAIEELDKCQLLCHKCHVEKTWQGKRAQHGSLAMHQKHGCRCRMCRDAVRDYKRAWRARRKSN